MVGQDIFDLVIVVILVLFTLNGAVKGFVGGIIGILAIIGGFWAARTWNAVLVPYLTFISDPSLRTITACVILFVAAMLAVGVAGRLLKKIIAFSFVGWLDRFAGALLGLAKGILLLTLVLIVMEKMFHDSEFMRQSRAMPYFHSIMERIGTWLPPDLAKKLGF